MEEKKKKNSGAAAVTVAAAGAAIAAGAAFVSSESPEEVSTGEPVGGDEDILDGGMLSEVEVVGNAPVLDGGMLSEVEVVGNAPEHDGDIIADVENMEQAHGDDLVVAEPENIQANEVIAEAHSIIEDETIIPAETIIAAPEPIVQEEDDFADFEDNDSSATDDMISMIEGGVIDELTDSVRRVGEELGLIDNSEDVLPDFINDADISEFTKH